MNVTATTGRDTLLQTVLACLLALLVIDAFILRHLAGSAATMDYRSFYAASRLQLKDPSHLYDGAAQARVQNTLVGYQDYPLPYFHPPYELWVYAPFSRLPYSTSYAAFLVFNSGLLLLAIVALPELRTDRLPLLRVFPGLAYLLFVPTLAALRHGQDSILYLSVVTLAWRAWQGDRTWACGCLLGLALFRFQLTLPLFALLLLRRRSWAMAGGFLCSAVAVTAVSWWMTGTDGMRAFLRMLANSSLSHDHGSALQNTMAIHPLAMPNLYGLLSRGGLQQLPPGGAVALTLVLSAAVFVFSAFRCVWARTAAEAFAVAVLCSMCVSYHMYLHDLTLLPLTLTLLRGAAACWIGLAAYCLSVALLLTTGTSGFWLLAVPVVLLLFVPLRVDVHLFKEQQAVHPLAG